MRYFVLKEEEEEDEKGGGKEINIKISADKLIYYQERNVVENL